MDLASLLQGVGAIADTLSIGVSTQTLAESDEAKQTSASRNPEPQDQVTDKHQTKEKSHAKKTDQEIIAEARLAEIEQLRADRKHAHAHTMTRRR